MTGVQTCALPISEIAAEPTKTTGLRIPDRGRMPMRSSALSSRRLKTVRVDAAYGRKQVADIVKDQDLSRYTLWGLPAETDSLVCSNQCSRKIPSRGVLDRQRRRQDDRFDPMRGEGIHRTLADPAANHGPAPG